MKQFSHYLNAIFHVINNYPGHLLEAMKGHGNTKLQSRSLKTSAEKGLNVAH
jgi:hypothetical protein